MRRQGGDWRIYSKKSDRFCAYPRCPIGRGAGQGHIDECGRKCIRKRRGVSYVTPGRSPSRVASLTPPTRNGRGRNWRRTCPKTIKNFSAAPSNGAPFAPESLALFVTTLREPPSAQRGALSTSSPVAKRTAIGCGDYPPPEWSPAAENAPPTAARSAARLLRRRNH